MRHFLLTFITFFLSGSRHKRHIENGVDFRMLDHDSITKAKAAFVDCECEWGLFRYNRQQKYWKYTSLNVYLTRDRNVTLRKPIKMNTGILDLDMKGMVVQYNKYVKNRG